MTEADFRGNHKLRAALIKCMENPALIQALAIIKSSDDANDVPESAPEIASVRKLSARTAVEKAVQTLFRLTKPIPAAPTEPPMTFGTDHDAEDFDMLNAPTK